MRWTKHWKIRILLFLSVVGPGFITANVDNDSAGIFTYSQAGAQYGYALLWTLLPTTLALIIVQEMCARMGVVTGKGPELVRAQLPVLDHLVCLGDDCSHVGDVPVADVRPEHGVQRASPG